MFSVGEGEKSAWVYVSARVDTLARISQVLSRGAQIFHVSGPC